MFDFDILSNPKSTQSKKPETSKIKAKQSYSGHLQGQVLNCWKKSCISCDYETCCHWTMEMILSKWQDILWETILIFVAKHIHSQNPKIAIFLSKIKADYPNLNVPESNNNTVEIFTFVVGVLIYSPRGIVYPTPVINSTDSEIDHVVNTLKSCNLSHVINSVMRSGDSIVLAGLLNACIQHLEACDLNNSLRVLGWIIQMEKSKKYKEHISCGSRYQYSSWVFFLWEVLVVYSQTNKTNYYEIIKSWKVFYCDGYTKSSKTTRFPMIINALIILSQREYKELPCIYNKDIIQKACQNVEYVLYDIMKKKKEKQSYLF